MSMALQSDGPQLKELMDRHDAERERWYADHYQSLQGSLHLSGDGLLADYTHAVAALWVEWRAAKQTLNEARCKREKGRGRCPSEQTIIRLQKRHGLAWDTYNRALHSLKEMASNGHRRPPLSPGDLLASIGEHGGDE